MKKTRLLTIIVILIVALGLVTVSLAFAQGDDPDEEAAKAAAAEQAGHQERTPVPTGNQADAGGGYQLFAGLDDVTVPAFRIDPVTNLSFTVWSGVEVWGAAYDYDNDQVYVSEGTDLYVWPVGSPAPTFLATVSDTTGSNTSMEGLAYYDGALYASKVTSTGEGEGIFSINLTTFQSTRVITYPDPSQTTISGLDADPVTGQLYGTNDNIALRGLVSIDPDGTVTVVAPYMAGETDIDGLAVGGGRAYLIADDQTPPVFEVWDFNLAAYVTPITSPFTTTDVFAGGAWIEPVVDQPGIAFTKTVGTDVNACATTDEIAVPQFTQVTYCYDVMNTGTITLHYHDLVDTELGTILSGFPFTLTPGASVFLTDTDFIFANTVNTATWTACNLTINNASGFDCASPNAVDVVSATDVATVTLIPPSISLSKTVGTDPNVCAAGSNITVPMGTDVTYCYDVTNTGATTLTVHELDDSELGTILTGFPFILAPGASVFLTQTANIVTDTTNVATWTACNIDGDPDLTCFHTAAFDIVSDTATANVTIMPPTPSNPGIDLVKTVGTDNTVCAAGNNITVDDTVSEVYYCYTVTNTGDVTFTTHDLDDSVLGTILAGFPYTLGPGEDVFVYPVTGAITSSVTNVATWTAYFDTAAFVTGTATATVTLSDEPTDVALNTFTGGSNAITLPVMAALLAVFVLGAGWIIGLNQKNQKLIY